MAIVAATAIAAVLWTKVKLRLIALTQFSLVLFESCSVRIQSKNDKLHGVCVRVCGMKTYRKHSHSRELKIYVYLGDSCAL